MVNSTSKKFSRKLPKPERKSIADMNYGILASGSRLLPDIVDQLHFIRLTLWSVA